MSVPLRLEPPQPKAPDRRKSRARLRELLANEPDLEARFQSLRNIGMRVRACEIHLTTNCNIRCKGCWYFEGGFDTAVNDVRDLGAITDFVDRLVDDGFTQATLIGGEPTLVTPRMKPFIEKMPYITVSTNGLRPLPRDGFENVGLAVSIFGGGPLDDDLRAHKPNGAQFSGLFETSLGHYRDDPRVTYVMALNEDGIDYIEPTVRSIADNGNLVSFNFYSAYGTDHPLRMDGEKRILEEALRVRMLYPHAVVTHPYMIETLITGRTHWGGSFGYDVCPSISVDLPEHADRLSNGNPVLDGFAVYGADFESLQFCCTSGNCGDCRDSQGVYSWLLVSMNWFLDSADSFRTWLELAESYWRQWYWAQNISPNFARGKTAAQ